MQYIVYGLDGDPEIPCLNVTQNSTNMGALVINVVGPGNPYWAFNSLPTAVLTADQIGADFTDAPIASSVASENAAQVAAMYADPPPTGETNDGINKVWKVA